MSERERVGWVIRGVVRNALHVSGAQSLALIEEDTPEYRLAHQWCDERNSAGVGELTAAAWNKTALLLTQQWPRVDVLPVGDLWATQVQTLVGEWSAPDDARAQIEAAGGIERADNALRRWLERRETLESAFADLPEQARGPFLEAVRRGRSWRERAGLVPKLSTRTIGIDLFA